MKLIDWFKSIAFVLNDAEEGHEFSRYTLRQMVQAYNAGLCLVVKYRPDLFTEWKIVQLREGRLQDTRACCDNVLGVAGQTDRWGNTVKDLDGGRETTTKVKRNWKKPSCINFTGAPDGYTISNVDIDKNMNGRFSVDPPVPCDAEVFVRVKCVAGPCPINEADVEAESYVECDMMTALWYFVLARMQAGDQFTEVTFAAMRFNHKMFFEVLGVVQRQEDRFDSPEEA